MSSAQTGVFHPVSSAQTGDFTPHSSAQTGEFLHPVSSAKTGEFYTPFLTHKEVSVTTRFYQTILGFYMKCVAHDKCVLHQ